MAKYKANRNRYVSVVSDTDIIDNTVTYHKKFFSSAKAAEKDSWAREKQMRSMGDRGSFFDSFSHPNYSQFKKYKRIK